MANAVQWIKIVVDLFEDEKMLFIETLPNADSIMIIWLKLLCLAGKQNNKGVIMFNGKPYSEKMLSVIFRRDEKTISEALGVFEEYGMTKTVNGTITITNWGKHQNLDKIEANNAYMREYMRNYRKKQKRITEGETADKVNDKVKINPTDKETESDKEENKEIDLYENNTLSSCDDESLINYELVINSFHSICKSLPNVVKLTDKRKKSLRQLRAFLGEITFEKYFELIEKSDFLTGRKSTWRCNFDWIIKTENAVKILEGNYNNHNCQTTKKQDNYADCEKYKNLKMEV